MADRLLLLRFPGNCCDCRTALGRGSQGWWDSETGSIKCSTCKDSGDEGRSNLPTTQPPPAAAADTLSQMPGGSHAGGSARMMFQQKHQSRESRIDRTWGPLSGVVKFLSDDPQSTKAWAKGSEGERKLAAYLHRTVGDRSVMLHDRRIPGSRANIDHVIVAASGIWIVDCKSYKGKVEQRDVGKWLTTDNRLYVDGRDRSNLASGLVKQIVAVLKAIDGAAIDISVMAALCFVDSDWSLFAKPFLQGGVLVTWPRMLSRAISEPGPLRPDDITHVARLLGAGLPAAIST